MLRQDDCLTIVRKLWPYLDDVLPDDLQEHVALHLAQCTECRSHFDFARTILHAIRQYGAGTEYADAGSLRVRVLDALAAANDTER